MYKVKMSKLSKKFKFNIEYLVIEPKTQENLVQCILNLNTMMV